MSGNSSLAMIAAVGPSRELGRGGDLVWHISADLKNFKRLTTGHPVIMGRKTWESLPKRPLLGRTNIVLSRKGEDISGAVLSNSVADALSACKGEEEVAFVIGGAEIYKAFMPFADALYLTRIDSDPGAGVDSWFPEYEDKWNLVEASDWEEDQKGIRYRFERWTRKES